ncbi:MAG: DUF485 domain-containing protein [Pseudonocardia sp.]|nr:DUF485 domain-containing protein [Pseudonocardia sp.]
MSEQRSSDAPPDDNPDVWSTVQHSAEYRELRATQRRFLVPASVVYLVVYFGFLVLALGAPSLFQQPLYGGLNIGFVMLTAMFVLVWIAVLVHNSIARRSWDPRIARVRAQVQPPGTHAGSDRPVKP